MPSSVAMVHADPRLVELAILDVIDVDADGSLRLNTEFLEACLEAFDADPSRFGTVFQDHILARAVAYGYAGCVDPDELALAALEVATGDAPGQSL